MKLAIVIYSDPGSEDALGRCFTGLTAVYEAKEKRDDVTLIFGGTGVRWPEVLSNKEHPANELYENVKDKLQGVCSSCAIIFQANEGAEKAGASLIGNVVVPNSVGSGLPSLRDLVADGYTILSF